MLIFLMDISETDILQGETNFLCKKVIIHMILNGWSLNVLKKNTYPLFLKKEIFHLPEKFTIRTECE